LEPGTVPREHSDRRPSYLIAILRWHACKPVQEPNWFKCQTGARQMEEHGGAAPNPATAKKQPPATPLRPSAFQSKRAETAAFDPDPAATGRFMVQRLRAHMAEMLQPFPLSRIMLARGRRFAFKYLTKMTAGFNPPFNSVPWPPYVRLAKAARCIHAHGAKATDSRSRALAGRGTITRRAGDPGPSAKTELPPPQTCCLPWRSLINSSE
jgi:hypothetical protein